MHQHPRWRQSQRQMRGDGFPLPVLLMILGVVVFIASVLLERCAF